MMSTKSLSLQLLVAVIAMSCVSSYGFNAQFSRLADRTSLSPSKRQSHYKTSLNSDLNGTNEKDSRINRLKAEAAQLRAEAAKLEAEQKALIANALNEIFTSFDLNNDGSISRDELRLGLERELRSQITEKDVNELMKTFDKSGDGLLQFDEFRSLEEFRRKLEQLAGDERTAAQLAAMEAQKAKIEAKRLAEQAELLQQLVNDNPPTFSDRVVSLSPYLIPFFDVLPYGKQFAPNIENNPYTAFLAVLYHLYETIPFSGLLAFFALSLLSGNLSLNRLVRFNIQQAISIDIALILPGLVGGIASFALPYLGLIVTPELEETASAITFLFFSSLLLYSLITSLVFGTEPNKIPFISEQVEERLRLRSSLSLGIDEEDLNKSKSKNKKKDDDSKSSK